MTPDVKPYREMKDSGALWVGRVPAHWRCSKLRQCVRFVGGLTPSMEDRSLWDGDVPWVTPKDMKRPAIGDSILRVSAKALGTSGLRLIPAGAVLMVVRGMILARRVPVAWTTHPVTVNQDMKALIPKPSLRARFLALQLEAASDGVNPMIDEAGHGTRRLPTERLRDLAVVLPSEEEQAAIVRFLDHADRRIRCYIRGKQKLIALLGEQKQAIIHRAVSRGLDPGVRLKWSGVPWLGDVPEHWTVASLRHRYSQELGKMLDTKRLTGSHPVPYLRNTDVQWGRISTVDLPVMDITPSEYPRYTVKRGDVLVCEGGEVGRCAIWAGDLEPCGYQKALHRLRPRQITCDSPRFLYYALLCAAKHGAFDDGHLSTIAHLTGDKLRAHRFAFPPVGEQDDVVAFLDRELRRLGATALVAEREISLLREYLSRLIADVVTGKLDVREAAASLPDEPKDVLDDPFESMADVEVDSDDDAAAGEVEV